MECYCEIGEWPKFSRDSFPKSRKQHTCCECGSIIDIGEQYHCFTGMWDKFMIYRTCLICHKIRIEVEKTIGESPAFGTLYDCTGYQFESAGILEVQR